MLDPSIVGALCTHDRTFAGWPHVANTVAEVITRHKKYNHFDSSRHIIEVDPFTVEAIVWNHASASTPPCLSILVRPYLKSKIPHPSQM